MSISARSKAEILDRLRLTESLLVVATQRSDQLEAKLAEAKRDTRLLREALAQANVAMDHMGDRLNDMDAITKEDELLLDPIFDAVMDALAPPAPKEAVNEVRGC